MKITDCPDEIRTLAEKADVVHVVSAEGECGLRDFVSGMLSYHPGWMLFLYKVRKIPAKLLGLKANDNEWPEVKPEEVPMSPGEKILFMNVNSALEDSHWCGEVHDNHLSCRLAAVAEPLNGGGTRFHLLTIVNYANWKGPVYYNLIRPFHYLVVAGMARKGVEKRA